MKVTSKSIESRPWSSDGMTLRTYKEASATVPNRLGKGKPVIEVRYAADTKKSLQKKATKMVKKATGKK